MNLHYLIVKHFVEKGHAPTNEELEELSGLQQAEVEQELVDLEAKHGVVLHPGTNKIWFAHPFASTPTGWWVESNGRGWFGNCAWCSLGICALLGDKAHVHTCLGGEDKKAVLSVSADGPEQTDFVIHFLVRPKDAWNNVIFHCATVNLFQAEKDVDEWCHRHQLPKGAVVPVAQVWDLAKAWYGNHLAKNWEKWTVKEAQEIFDGVGLTSDFWNLGDQKEDETF